MPSFWDEQEKNRKAMLQAGEQLVGEKLRVKSYGGRTRRDDKEQAEKERRRRWAERANKKCGWR